MNAQDIARIERALVELCEAGNLQAIQWALSNLRPRRWHMAPESWPRSNQKDVGILGALRESAKELSPASDEPRVTYGVLDEGEDNFG